jgi:uncharacterized membrane protein (UPF0127 family)
LGQPTTLKRFRVRNRDRGTVLADDVALASSHWARFWGLMFRRGLAPGTGILLTKSTSLHGFFMFFRWDAVYVDDDGKVVKVVDGMKPWTISFGGKGAKHALELESGAAARSGTEAGDQLLFEDVARDESAAA